MRPGRAAQVVAKRLFAVVLLAAVVLNASCGGDDDDETTGGSSTPSVGQAVTDCVAPANAAASAGKRVTVCGLVAGANYEASVSGQPTFINFDKPYPNHVFTALIWGSSRKRFEPPPEQQFRKGKNVCVTGLVKIYRSKPEIEVSDPAQIRVC